MPLVRISLVRRNDGGVTAERLGDLVHAALVETCGVPAADRFQIVTEHERAELRVTPEYLGIPHGDAVVLVQITLNAGRTVDQKRSLYARIARGCEDCGVPTADAVVNLVEVAPENWSFGNGDAPYAR